MGKAISAIARYKQGSTQMLAAGVLEVLAALPAGVQNGDDGDENDETAASAGGRLTGKTTSYVSAAFNKAVDNKG